MPKHIEELEFFEETLPEGKAKKKSPKKKSPKKKSPSPKKKTPSPKKRISKSRSLSSPSKKCQQIERECGFVTKRSLEAMLGSPKKAKKTKKSPKKTKKSPRSPKSKKEKGERKTSAYNMFVKENRPPLHYQKASPNASESAKKAAAARFRAEFGRGTKEVAAQWKAASAAVRARYQAKADAVNKAKGL